ncbi:hypothetical protein TIFTF001_002515 [Ficus carica]|uniref:Uncharacterized protein n=1 Tax=Ficus carica TaxID=3494 RepID=A0AA87ZDH7_FICCA|nr:hypothetical protein TIFTF001_002515 [Ficus carica]
MTPHRSPLPRRRRRKGGGIAVAPIAMIEPVEDVSLCDRKDTEQLPPPRSTGIASRGMRGETSSTS